MSLSPPICHTLNMLGGREIHKFRSILRLLGKKGLMGNIPPSPQVPGKFWFIRSLDQRIVLYSFYNSRPLTVIFSFLFSGSDENRQPPLVKQPTTTQQEGIWKIVI